MAIALMIIRQTEFNWFIHTTEMTYKSITELSISFSVDILKISKNIHYSLVHGVTGKRGNTHTVKAQARLTSRGSIVLSQCKLSGCELWPRALFNTRGIITGADQAAAKTAVTESGQQLLCIFPRETRRQTDI